MGTNSPRGRYDFEDIPRLNALLDHGLLLGLADDDHTQYILANGTRALAGNWDLGGFNLTNGGDAAFTKVVVDNISIDDITIISTGTSPLEIGSAGGKNLTLAAGIPTGNALISILAANFSISGEDVEQDGTNPDYSMMGTGSAFFQVIGDSGGSACDTRIFSSGSGCFVGAFSNDDLLLAANGSEKARVTTGGNFVITGSDIGITGATDLLSLAANVLTVNGTGTATTSWVVGNLTMTSAGFNHTTEATTGFSFISDTGYFFAAKAVEFLRMNKGKFPFTTFNDDGEDINVIFKTDDGGSLLLIDAGANEIYIGDGGSTNYTKFSNTGDRTFVGTAGEIFGHMYVAASFNVGTQQNVITEVEDAGEDGWTAGELNVSTFPTGGTEHYLVAGAVGMYEVSWDLSISTANASGGEIHGGIMVNSTAIRDKGEGHRKISASNDTGSMSGHAIIDIASVAGTADEISLWLLNTSNDNDITVEHGNVCIAQIGGT